MPNQAEDDVRTDYSYWTGRLVMAINLALPAMRKSRGSQRMLRDALNDFLSSPAAPPDLPEYLRQARYGKL